MKRVICLAIVLFIGAQLPVVAATCKDEPRQLMASYRIKHFNHDVVTEQEQLTVTRLNDQVGHFYQHKQYGDWWTKVNNERLMLTRFFPTFGKAIEYQADEIKEDPSLTWQQLWQILPDSFIEKMERKAVQSRGCYRVEVMSLTQGDKEYTLHWLPTLRLIEQFDVAVKGQQKVSWQLMNIESDVEQLQQHVDRISNYQTIDYADIGDNEADPFLAKMIHQGFKPSATVSHHH